MPVNVPDNPKVYTTKYTNFKGVDYTNDPSNVWYRRSPNGLNMLPDLDGRPYKRNGWKIEFTSDDFCDAAGVSPRVAVEQYKVDYFELDGQDWLAIYTSLGLFFYSNSLMFINSYLPEIQLFSKSSFYQKGDYVYVYESGVVPPDKLYYKADAEKTPQAWSTTGWTAVSATDIKNGNYSVAFPPQNKEDEGMAIIDYTKSFFFEGQGTAGYYLFVGTQLFRFDGEKLREVKAKIPTVLIAATPPTGAGTLGEAVNLLTETRAIQYTGDGVTSVYKLPQPYEKKTVGGTTYNTGVLYVCKANPAYENGWEEIDGWSYTQNPDEIQFNSTPASSTTDNIRIVYKPSTMSVEEKTRTLPTQTLTIKRTIDYETTEMWMWNEAQGYHWVDFGGQLGAKLGLGDGSYFSNITTPTYEINNVKQPISSNVYCDIYSNGAWVENSQYLTATPNAYGSAVTVSGTNNGAPVWNNYTPSSTSVISSVKTYGTPYTSNGQKYRSGHVWDIRTSSYQVRVRYISLAYSQSGGSLNRNAFFASSRALVYGNGIINQVFLTASPMSEYSSRVWYSAATDPSYFPDTNYIEVGSSDTHIMGLIRVGQYLGVVKQGSGKETSVYLAYATSFEDITTYAVKQSVNGVGAISNGAFNILNDEPLFLSSEGVMGIEPSEDDERKLRNRSYYINKPLMSEASVNSAFSFVYDGMYWLGVDGRCYVLDGAQKTSWENAKTNLQYEAYYLDNIPAKCFAKKDNRLWFIDRKGNLCRFRDDNDSLRYVDDYTTENISLTSTPLLGASPTSMPTTSVYKTETNFTTAQEWTDELRDSIYADGYTFLFKDYPYLETDKSIEGLTFYLTVDGSPMTVALDDTDFTVSGTGLTIVSGLSEFTQATIPDVVTSATYYIGFEITRWHTPSVGDVVNIQMATKTAPYTVTAIDGDDASISQGVPIHAVWGTISDDDGSAHYLKNLQKKGSLVALLPATSSGVIISVKADEKEAKFVGQAQQGQHIIPFNVYMKKKVKKYKRLQITCENNTYNEPFGIDEIIKSYTMGNYAKK